LVAVCDAKWGGSTLPHAIVAMTAASKNRTHSNRNSSAESSASILTLRFNFKLQIWRDNIKMDVRGKAEKI
jgi:hypothetical protein